MQVIRIEHPSNGKGIFTNSELLTENYYRAYWVKRHNGMQTARNINGWDISFYCGYRDIEEMHKWLTNNEIKRFIRKGFVVLSLEVSDYIDTDPNQILYKKKSITKQEDISNLFLTNKN